MAITILTNPQQITPSDNPVTWSFSSNQTNQPNFYFLVEVYLNTGGLSFDLLERHKVYPEVSTSGKIDISSITQRYCDITKANIIGVETINNNNRFRLEIKEYYGATPVEQSSVTTSSVRCFKAKLNRRGFLNFDYLDYQMRAGVNDSKFLTLYPRSESIKIRDNEKLIMHALTDVNADRANFVYYNYSGNAYNAYLVGFIDGVINAFDFGLSNLKALNPTADYSILSYYEINFSSVNGNSTENLRVEVDQSCKYSTGQRLHFLNSLGGIDSFSFNLLGRQNTDVNSFGYERNFGGFDDSGNFSYSLEQGTAIDYLKEFTNTLTLTSDWINQSVQNWLSSELYNSPAVWLEVDGILERVKVTNSAYVKGIEENDNMLQEEVTVVLGTDSSVNV